MGVPGHEEFKDPVEALEALAGIFAERFNIDFNDKEVVEEKWSIL